MASASAQAAEPDDATDASQEALTIAVETGSRRTVHELTRLHTPRALANTTGRPQPARRRLAQWRVIQFVTTRMTSACHRWLCGSA